MNASPTSSGRRVAVIDIGTNTLLLLIAEQQPDGSLAALHDACSFGRLGQGLDRSGALAAEAVERSLGFLREYRVLMDAHGVSEVAAVGTQALREAANRDAFVVPAREILGAPLEIIAGEREAELVYRAVAASFPDLAREPFVVADVGGGSTEIIAAGPEGVSSSTSVPIGSVRLSERHLADDPPTEAQRRALVADIDAALEPLALPTQVRLVGTAGTATTMASIKLALEHYQRERIHGLVMTPAEVEQQLERLFALSVTERRALPGLEVQRADVITAGATIFARLLRRLEGRDFLVGDCGVRWGLAYERLG
ncbi:Ppx/GppA phosphatase family protein [Haliangium ochraceum]|uniref:Ppx/GppA phosphatase n=1 Tax=Haliangium ochraceum (strain DSM 14365 / JCM 11303 / SMP-2) TaxID=502025 RepID=D0LGM7_HALO1|nr:Ppx/GppA phosphatase family protein [Haliangium ochraceum]ACY12773.1 Ppx/GppA phosphatase [Haliangium ochraceum DSM 14365]